MKRSLLSILACPYCGGELNVSAGVAAGADPIENALLSCECSEFPVVAGIPIFKRSGAVDVMKDSEDGVLRSGPPVETIVELIRSGDAKTALLLLLTRPGRHERYVRHALGLLPPAFRRVLSGPASRVWSVRPGLRPVREILARPASVLEVFDLFFRRLEMWPPHLYNYFAFRFGQPRYLTGLSLASLMSHSTRPILDLACGVGHMLHYWSMSRPRQPLVGLDRTFFLLYIAKRWIAPNADYICAEGDMGLPFRGRSMSGVYCSDAFHYFLRKSQAAREARRVLDDNGVIALSRIGNALVPPNEGYELAPESYGELFGEMTTRLVGDKAVLEAYLEKRGPALGSQGPLEKLREVKWISLVATDSAGVLPDHRSFDVWPHSLGQLAVNPLYRRVGATRSGMVELKLEFPSARYALANAECRQYMSESVSLDREVLDDVANGVRSEAVEALIRNCVVIGTPENYGSVG
ncbi:MAG TPA: methyltransferase domain-containing protein [Thermoanaerobaculia bacterium]|jgi:SAM-dependent methyltransferase/uncharacterized protein YbaR (Trm112 family)